MSIREQLCAHEEIAEEWLLYYPARKADIEHTRGDIIDGSSKPSDAGKTTHISQVTANKAIRLSRTWDDADWLAAVEHCYSEFPEHYKRLLKIRWGQLDGRIICHVGRPGWIEDAILHYADQTGQWPHNNTVSKWWRDMVVTLTRWAEYRGCYK